MDDGLGLSGTGSSPGSAEKGKAPMEVQQRAETLKHKCIKVRIFCIPASLNSADITLTCSNLDDPCMHHICSLKCSCGPPIRDNRNSHKGALACITLLV